MRKEDEAEFHKFVAIRMDRWRRSAYLVCQDWHLADDLVSITVIRLYRSWHKVHRADNPDAYAHEVLTRCWLSERKRPWSRREQSSAMPLDQIWAPPDHVGESLGKALNASAGRCNFR